MSALLEEATDWVDVCALADLTIRRGAAALVHGTQVALFRLADDEVVAVGNYDPFSDAFVLSRGIVGSKGDAVKVASPVFKHSFDLHSGACLDDASVTIPTYDVIVVDGRVMVATS